MCGCGVEREDRDPVQETLANLEAAGFPAHDLQRVGDAVYVGQDVRVSLQASRELLAVEGDGHEHYRTANLVSTSIQRIYVRPSTSMPNSIRVQLVEAMANFNDLALRISFELPPHECEWDPNCDPLPPTALIDLIINPVLPSGASATSVFPAGGEPGIRIELGPEVAQLAPNVIKHLLTHELGHTLGLRHSDYFNRAISCGGVAVNEGSAGVGAIHIVGTPTGATAGGSIMNTCIPPGTPGELTSSDVTALRALYR